MKDRDQAEFIEWSRARAGALRRTAYLLTGNLSDADDLVQTALAKMYLHWTKVRAGEERDAYARRVLINSQTSVWSRKRIEESPWGRAVAPALEGSTDDPHVHADPLWRALSRLERKERAVVVLRYYEKLSEAETAKILGVRQAAVKAAAAAALAKLQDEAIVLNSVELTPRSEHVAHDTPTAALREGSA